MRLIDRQGRVVNVTEYDRRADLPVFCAEVVSTDGEVVDYIDPILGHTGLTQMMISRGWKEAA